MKKKTIVIILSIIVIIIGFIFGYLGLFGKKELTYQLVEVKRGEIVQKVSVIGTVAPADKIDLQFENSGKVSEINVKIGDKVSNGQTLIKLNTGELSGQLQAALASLEIARAGLSQVLSGSRPEEIKIYEIAVMNAQDDAANKEQDLINAQNSVQDLLDQAYNLAFAASKSAYTANDKAITQTLFDMRQKYFNTYSNQIALYVRETENIAKADLSSVKNYLDMAQNNPSYANIDALLNQMEKSLASARNALKVLRESMDAPLYGDYVLFSDKSLVDAERINIDSAYGNIISNKQNISAVKINNQAGLDRANSGLDASQAVLKSAQAQLDFKKAGARQSDIDIARAQVRQAQANVSQINERIAKSILSSPINGIITDISVAIGEMASLGRTAVLIISLGAFEIEANVSETEISKININNNVSMTLDALSPLEIFSGKVIKIDPAETVVSGVIYYKVTLIFSGKDNRIKPGMTVNLDIETARKENVLYLPYFAISGTDSQKYVLISEGETTKQKNIKTGLKGENDVEIIEGLTEGEKVVVQQWGSD